LSDAPLPVDPGTGLLVPGPGYAMSFPWRPGTSPIHLESAAPWLRAPLAENVGFFDVDLLGIHALAERISWGYGDLLINEVARRLQAYASDGVAFRIGTDSFLICEPSVSRSSILLRIAAIRGVVVAPVPYPEASTTVGLRCTIGVALSRGGEDGGNLFERVLAATGEAQARGIDQFIEA
jgi:GGDEF domain-containing protein